MIQKDNNDSHDQKDIKDKMMTTKSKEVNKTIKKCIFHKKTTRQYFLNKISYNLPSFSLISTPSILELQACNSKSYCTLERLEEAG